jgi:hypothetical protein
MIANESVAHMQSKLPSVAHVFFEEKGQDLGLDTWEVASLLRAVSSFLDSLE